MSPEPNSHEVTYIQYLKSVVVVEQVESGLLILPIQPIKSFSFFFFFFFFLGGGCESCLKWKLQLVIWFDSISILKCYITIQTVQLRTTDYNQRPEIITYTRTLKLACVTSHLLVVQITYLRYKSLTWDRSHLWYKSLSWGTSYLLEKHVSYLKYKSVTWGTRHLLEVQDIYLWYKSLEIQVTWNTSLEVQVSYLRYKSLTWGTSHLLEVQVTYLRYKFPSWDTSSLHMIQVTYLRYMSLTWDTSHLFEVQVTWDTSHLLLVQITNFRNKSLSWDTGHPLYKLPTLDTSHSLVVQVPYLRYKSLIWGTSHLLEVLLVSGLRSSRNTNNAISSRLVFKSFISCKSVCVCNVFRTEKLNNILGQENIWNVLVNICWCRPLKTNI